MLIFYAFIQYILILSIIHRANTELLSDINLINIIYDHQHQYRNINSTSFPNGVILATIPVGTPLYRIETGDVSENPHYWFCFMPEMCYTVVGNYRKDLPFKSFLVSKPLKVWAYSGVSTFLHNLQNYHLYGTHRISYQFDDHMNDTCMHSSNINGFVRFAHDWELMLCNAMDYVTELPQQEIQLLIDSNYGIFHGLESKSSLIGRRFQFDWGSITILQPDLRFKYSNNPFRIRYSLKDYFKADINNSVKAFQQSVERMTSNYFRNPVDLSLNQRIEITVKEFVEHYQEVLKKLATLDRMNNHDVYTQLEMAFGRFGHWNLEDLSVRIQKCSNWPSYIVQNIKSLFDPLRQQQVEAIERALYNVANMICEQLLPQWKSIDQVDKKNIKNVVHILTDLLQWASFVDCDCDEGSVCFKQFPTVDYNKQTVEKPYQCLNFNKQFVSGFKIQRKQIV